MINKGLLLEKLKSQSIQLRRKIESGDDNLPIELGLPKVLSDIENELNNSSPDKEKLENGAYGIFKLVTESYLFEKSTLGQELLSLRGRIRDFAATLAKSD